MSWQQTPRPPLRSRLGVMLRPPRRLRLHRGGVVLIAGVLSLGLATLNTGNNLLYLLVGSLLGLITLSGWLSERAVTGIRVSRQVPFGATAGQPLRIEYRVENRKQHLASAGLELRELLLGRGGARVRPQVHESPYLPFIGPGRTATAVGILSLPRRGAYRFQGAVVATSYPFGLFSKERTLDLPGTLVVWPRSDRPVSIDQVVGPGSGRRLPSAPALAGSGGGEYRGLRSYRPGDDPRDIHWRSTARRAEPIVREYDRDQGEGWWIVLDLAAPDEDSGERAVELAASLAADATARGSRFGFAAGSARVAPPATGGARLEAVLDVLAEIEMDGAELVLPAPASDCILVTAGGWPGPGFGGVISARAEL